MGSTEPENKRIEKISGREEERLDEATNRKSIKEAERLLKSEKETKELIDKIAPFLPDVADQKESKTIKIMTWLGIGVLFFTFIYIFSNFIMFLVLLGEQTLSSTLINFIIFILIWNFTLTSLLIFGFRDSLHNLKMFFLRRNGYGYSILFDRDRGIKRFVVKLNVKMFKIFGKIYMTNRKKLRLWENRIPTYIHEAGTLEPLDIGLGQKETAIDSDEYQMTVELAEQAGMRRVGKTTKILLFGLCIVAFLVIASVAISYQSSQAIDKIVPFLIQMNEKLQNLNQTIVLVGG